MDTVPAIRHEARTGTSPEFDAVVIPGGYAPDLMRRHESMVKLVREAAQQGKVVAAICHAGWMLARRVLAAAMVGVSRRKWICTTVRDRDARPA